MLRQVFFELPPPPDVGQQITSTAHLHHIDGVRIRIEALVQSNDVLVPRPFQDVVLLHYLLQGTLIRHIGLINGLEGHKLAGEPIDGQIDLSERALSDHLADLVVVDLCVELLVRDVGEDVVQDQFSWCQLATIKLGFSNDTRRLLRPLFRLHRLSLMPQFAAALLRKLVIVIGADISPDLLFLLIVGLLE